MIAVENRGNGSKKKRRSRRQIIGVGRHPFSKPRTIAQVGQTSFRLPVEQTRMSTLETSSVVSHNAGGQREAGSPCRWPSISPKETHFAELSAAGHEDYALLLRWDHLDESPSLVASLKRAGKRRWKWSLPAATATRCGTCAGRLVSRYSLAFIASHNNNMPSSFSPPLKQSTYLGFDYGDKHIGVAVGQKLTCTATGLETIPALVKQPMWDAITKLVETWNPQGFVVGISYQEDGSENPITRYILKFCRQLEGRYRLPVYTIDETLTTRESKSLYYESRAKSSHKFGAVKDILAAQLILQTWLEHTAQQERQCPDSN